MQSGWANRPLRKTNRMGRKPLRAVIRRKLTSAGASAKAVVSPEPSSVGIGMGSLQAHPLCEKPWQAKASSYQPGQAGTSRS